MELEGSLEAQVPAAEHVTGHSFLFVGTGAPRECLPCPVWPRGHMDGSPGPPPPRCSNAGAPQAAPAGTNHLVWAGDGLRSSSLLGGACAWLLVCMHGRMTSAAGGREHFLGAFGNLETGGTELRRLEGLALDRLEQVLAVENTGGGRLAAAKLHGAHVDWPQLPTTAHCRKTALKFKKQYIDTILAGRD